MKRELTKKLKTLAMVGALSLISSNAMAILTISIELGGNTESNDWDDLTATRLPTYGQGPLGGFPGFGAWPAPLAPNVAGSAGNALFNKLGGTGYAGGQAIYTFPSDFASGPGGTFLLTSAGPLIANLETVIFTLDLGQGIGFLDALPVLNYNGGSQALAFDHTLTGEGDYSFVNLADPGAPLQSTEWAFQWDLTGLGVTSYNIVWTTSGHATTYEVGTIHGDTFTQAIPEPASGALLIGAASLLLLRRRRD